MTPDHETASSRATRRARSLNEQLYLDNIRISPS